MAIDQWDINIEFGYQIVYHKFRMLGLLFYQHYRVYRYNWVKKSPWTIPSSRIWRSLTQLRSGALTALAVVGTDLPFFLTMFHMEVNISYGQLPIGILDLPIKNGDCPIAMLVYFSFHFQRTKYTVVLILSSSESAQLDDLNCKFWVIPIWGLFWGILW